MIHAYCIFQFLIFIFINERKGNVDILFILRNPNVYYK